MKMRPTTEEDERERYSGVSVEEVVALCHSKIIDR